MSQYFYTVSVLPAVSFAEPPFFSADAFLEECESFVSAADMAMIRSASLDGGDETAGVLGEWNAFSRSVKAELARARAAVLGWETEAPTETTSADPRLADFSRSLTTQENPLRAELALLQRMWAYLDELELGHFFDRDRLVVYFLRVQISARRATLTDLEAGNEEFTRQYEEVAQTTMEIV